MLKALVTGIAGFTGYYLAETLEKRGISVVGLSQFGDEIHHVNHVHTADITDFNAVRGVVLAEKPDFVIHLAAISFVLHDNIEEIYRTNLIGTRNLLDALSESPNRPTAVLLASSANVYGNSREGMIDESIAPAPANDYGVAKAAAELLGGIYRDRLPLIVVRPFNYTGRGQAEHFLIPKIVSHIRKRSAEIELGNLEVARDFSDVRGIVDIYARLLETPAAVGKTFNVCSGRATSLRELLELVRRISGHDMGVRVNPFLVRSDEVKMLWGSPEKLEGMIGPLGMPTLEDTLRWMLED